MNIEIKRVETFGAGVKAFRILPVKGSENSARQSSADSKVTENAQLFGAYLRGKLPPKSK